MDSSSPRYGEKAGYCSAVCLETGEVEWMDLEGNSNSQTSNAFLTQLRERHTGPLNVIRDNAPAHRLAATPKPRLSGRGTPGRWDPGQRAGAPWRGGGGILRTPGLGLRPVNPRFHEGKLCRATARTSTPMRRFGVGREKKPPETTA